MADAEESEIIAKYHEDFPASIAFADSQDGRSLDERYAELGLELTLEATRRVDQRRQHANTRVHASDEAHQFSPLPFPIPTAPSARLIRGAAFQVIEGQAAPHAELFKSQSSADHHLRLAITSAETMTTLPHALAALSTLWTQQAVAMRVEGTQLLLRWSTFVAVASATRASSGTVPQRLQPQSGPSPTQQRSKHVQPVATTARAAVTEGIDYSAVYAARDALQTQLAHLSAAHTVAEARAKRLTLASTLLPVSAGRNTANLGRNTNGSVVGAQFGLPGVETAASVASSSTQQAMATMAAVAGGNLVGDAAAAMSLLAPGDFVGIASILCSKAAATTKISRVRAMVHQLPLSHQLLLASAVHAALTNPLLSVESSTAFPTESINLRAQRSDKQTARDGSSSPAGTAVAHAAAHSPSSPRDGDGTTPQRQREEKKTLARAAPSVFSVAGGTGASIASLRAALDAPFLARVPLVADCETPDTIDAALGALMRAYRVSRLSPPDAEEGRFRISRRFVSLHAEQEATLRLHPPPDSAADFFQFSKGGTSAQGTVYMPGLNGGPKQAVNEERNRSTGAAANTLGAALPRPPAAAAAPDPTAKDVVTESGAAAGRAGVGTYRVLKSSSTWRAISPFSLDPTESTRRYLALLNASVGMLSSSLVASMAKLSLSSPRHALASLGLDASGYALGDAAMQADGAKVRDTRADASNAHSANVAGVAMLRHIRARALRMQVLDNLNCVESCLRTCAVAVHASLASEAMVVDGIDLSVRTQQSSTFVAGASTTESPQALLRRVALDASNGDPISAIAAAAGTAPRAEGDGPTSTASASLAAAFQPLVGAAVLGASVPSNMKNATSDRVMNERNAAVLEAHAACMKHFAQLIGEGGVQSGLVSRILQRGLDNRVPAPQAHGMVGQAVRVVDLSHGHDVVYDAATVALTAVEKRLLLLGTMYVDAYIAVSSKDPSSTAKSAGGNAAGGAAVSTVGSAGAAAAERVHYDLVVYDLLLWESRWQTARRRVVELLTLLVENATDPAVRLQFARLAADYGTRVPQLDLSPSLLSTAGLPVAMGRLQSISALYFSSGYDIEVSRLNAIHTLISDVISDAAVGEGAAASATYAAACRSAGVILPVGVDDVGLPTPSGAATRATRTAPDGSNPYEVRPEGYTAASTAGTMVSVTADSPGGSIAGPPTESSSGSGLLSSCWPGGPSFSVTPSFSPSPIFHIYPAVCDALADVLVGIDHAAESFTASICGPGHVTSVFVPIPLNADDTAAAPVGHASGRGVPSSPTGASGAVGGGGGANGGPSSGGSPSDRRGSAYEANEGEGEQREGNSGVGTAHGGLGTTAAAALAANGRSLSQRALPLMILHPAAPTVLVLNAVRPRIAAAAAAAAALHAVSLWREVADERAAADGGAGRTLLALNSLFERTPAALAAAVAHAPVTIAPSTRSTAPIASAAGADVVTRAPMAAAHDDGGFRLTSEGDILRRWASLLDGIFAAIDLRDDVVSTQSVHHAIARHATLAGMRVRRFLFLPIDFEARRAQAEVDDVAVQASELTHTAEAIFAEARSVLRPPCGLAVDEVDPSLAPPLGDRSVAVAVGVLNSARVGSFASSVAAGAEDLSYLRTGSTSTPVGGSVLSGDVWSLSLGASGAFSPLRRALVAQRAAVALAEGVARLNGTSCCAFLCSLAGPIGQSIARAVGHALPSLNGSPAERGSVGIPNALLPNTGIERGGSSGLRALETSSLRAWWAMDLAPPREGVSALASDLLVPLFDRPTEDAIGPDVVGLLPAGTHHVTSASGPMLSFVTTRAVLQDVYVSLNAIRSTHRSALLPGLSDNLQVLMQSRRGDANASTLSYLKASHMFDYCHATTLAAAVLCAKVDTIEAYRSLRCIASSLPAKVQPPASIAIGMPFDPIRPFARSERSEAAAAVADAANAISHQGLSSLATASCVIARDLCVEEACYVPHWTQMLVGEFAPFSQVAAEDAADGANEEDGATALRPQTAGLSPSVGSLLRTARAFVCTARVGLALCTLLRSSFALGQVSMCASLAHAVSHPEVSKAQGLIAFQSSIGSFDKVRADLDTLDSRQATRLVTELLDAKARLSVWRLSAITHVGLRTAGLEGHLVPYAHFLAAHQSLHSQATLPHPHLTPPALLFPSPEGQWLTSPTLFAPDRAAISKIRAARTEYAPADGVTNATCAIADWARPRMNVVSARGAGLRGGKRQEADTAGSAAGGAAGAAGGGAATLATRDAAVVAQTVVRALTTMLFDLYTNGAAVADASEPAMRSGAGGVGEGATVIQVSNGSDHPDVSLDDAPAGSTVALSRAGFHRRPTCVAGDMIERWTLNVVTSMSSWRVLEDVVAEVRSIDRTVSECVDDAGGSATGQVVQFVVEEHAVVGVLLLKHTLKTAFARMLHSGSLPPRLARAVAQTVAAAAQDGPSVPLSNTSRMLMNYYSRVDDAFQRAVEAPSRILCERAVFEAGAKGMRGSSATRRLDVVLARQVINCILLGIQTREAAAAWAVVTAMDAAAAGAAHSPQVVAAYRAVGIAVPTSAAWAAQHAAEDAAATSKGVMGAPTAANLWLEQQQAAWGPGKLAARAQRTALTATIAQFIRDLLSRAMAARLDNSDDVIIHFTEAWVATCLDTLSSRVAQWGDALLAEAHASQAVVTSQQQHLLDSLSACVTSLQLEGAIQGVNQIRLVDVQVAERHHALQLGYESITREYAVLQWRLATTSEAVRHQLESEIGVKMGALVVENQALEAKFNDYRSTLTREMHRSLEDIKRQSMLRIGRSDVAPLHMKRQALRIALSDEDASRLKDEVVELRLMLRKVRLWSDLRQAHTNAQHQREVAILQARLNEMVLRGHSDVDSSGQQAARLKELLAKTQMQLASTELECEHLRRDLQTQLRNKTSRVVHHAAESKVDGRTSPTPPAERDAHSAPASTALVASPGRALTVHDRRGVAASRHGAPPSRVGQVDTTPLLGEIRQLRDENDKLRSQVSVLTSRLGASQGRSRSVSHQPQPVDDDEDTMSASPLRTPTASGAAAEIASLKRKLALERQLKRQAFSKLEAATGSSTQPTSEWRERYFEMATALQEAILDLDAARNALAAHGIALPQRDAEEEVSGAAQVLAATVTGRSDNPRGLKLPPL